MRPPRPVLITVAGVTVTGSLLLAPHSATADRRPPVREGAARDRGAASTPLSAARQALKAPVTALPSRLSLSGSSLRGYPREQLLAPDPENPADRSIKPGLIPYHAIAPRLNALQRLGDRVSVEVGTSSPPPSPRCARCGRSRSTSSPR